MRLKFEGPEQVKENVREARVGAAIDTMLQDLRYAFRTLRKSPAFASRQFSRSALAIGANTAIYSIVDAALLRPLPVPEPDRLFTLATLQIQEQGKERPVEDVRSAIRCYSSFALPPEIPRALGSSATETRRHTNTEEGCPDRESDLPVRLRGRVRHSCTSLQRWAASLPPPRIASRGDILIW